MSAEHGMRVELLAASMENHAVGLDNAHRALEHIGHTFDEVVGLGEEVLVHLANAGEAAHRITEVVQRERFTLGTIDNDLTATGGELTSTVQEAHSMLDSSSNDTVHEGLDKADASAAKAEAAETRVGMALEVGIALGRVLSELGGVIERARALGEDAKEKTELFGEEVKGGKEKAGEASGDAKAAGEILKVYGSQV